MNTNTNFNIGSFSSIITSIVSRVNIVVHHMMCVRISSSISAGAYIETNANRHIVISNMLARHLIISSCIRNHIEIHIW